MIGSVHLKEAPPVAKLNLPSQNEEDWRWSKLDILEPLSQEPHGGFPLPDYLSLWSDLEGPKLLFIDGVYQAEKSNPGPITIQSVKEDSKNPLALMTQGQTGWTLHLEQSYHQPIEVLYLGSGGSYHLPSSIRLADNVSATLIETYAGHGWGNRFSYFNLGKDAQLHRLARLCADSGFTSLVEEGEIGRAATLATDWMGCEGADSRVDQRFDLIANGATVLSGGAFLAKKSQHHDVMLVTRHSAPECSSRQKLRALADDKSTVSLAVRTEVASGAQKSDGEQSLKGLLLSRQATVNMKPELEIYADDVKCAHGAAVGELDSQALFYLESRGIAPEDAKELLVQSFILEAFVSKPDSALYSIWLNDAEHWAGEK
ncbi:MAG: SufD family Fe-S cluster assembly protein [Zymomonas mobilis subsp. pomaceae]|uniref:SufBD protein n=1 Tax=Zymomonas mobilis subsp. pomaceae (strain ATCC 29192 / DSM 22645 / JCM 10191 / CCUG 17912 / NBRC 13757 / NCIMB 11200 / NRRL B-4491 / Barker I) TaxID=579138 RepID=F8ESA9_ZYMMT|nr:SufD family Fe-S cluster assembly protein [Zymomonas mobilis]AEI37684.1 SufBD protein [Zymomonas mobilis subsp. pomaceae ATCC 29192]MDX5949051.1 SufD family Fe-S cluster assembly protein [Zymomonas mobilis subsp. pomaceae]GEB88856.1 Fe-S cluster assembly protein SufD [Zymomonas mobilis subsp. pomaceae]